jgi:hypothetical protein
MIERVQIDIAEHRAHHSALWRALFGRPSRKLSISARTRVSGNQAAFSRKEPMAVDSRHAILRSRSDDPRAKELSDEARHHGETAIRLGYKTAHGFAFKFGGRFGAGCINDRYFDRNIKVLRQWDAHFLARPASA